jgi:glycosyltransferase involved in cell wall biosynthesis
MKFSVLINNYDYGRYIVECIESVLAQTCPAHEIIVVDDGSSDDSVDLLKEHFAGRPELKIITQRNQGQISAIATGIEAATGDIVCLLDADDLHHPEYLAVLREEYARRKDVDLIFCRAEEPKESAAVVNQVWLDPGRDYDYGLTSLISYFGYVTWLGNNTSTISLRARLARSLGLDEAARHCYGGYAGDYALLYAASLHGARKFYLHRALVKYRVHDANHSIYGRSEIAQKQSRLVFCRSLINFFRRRCPLSDDMYVHLRAEMGSVPAPLPQHADYYRDAIAKEGRRHEAPLKMPLLYRVGNRLRSWRRRIIP